MGIIELFIFPILLATLGMPQDPPLKARRPKVQMI